LNYPWSLSSPAGPSSLFRNGATFLWRKTLGPRFAALQSTFSAQCGSGSILVRIRARLVYLSRSYPHDMDGVADDIGGAFGTCWSLGHGANMASQLGGNKHGLFDMRQMRRHALGG
jgi:hypothetical protein